MVPLYDSSGCYLVDQADRLLIDSLIDWKIESELIIDRDSFA